MRKLVFMIGSIYRKVLINGRIISMITPESNFVPMKIDLDNIPAKLNKKMNEEEVKLLKEISLLKTEEEMAKDIIKDFQRNGLRCIINEQIN